MQNIKVLEMINEGRIEELKDLLQDGIYTELLSSKKPGAKKRYAAMKKYFTYIKTVREALQKPCIIEYEGEPYTSFCNAHSIVLTTEPCGSIELYTDVDRYPDVTRLIHYKGIERKVDFSKVFAEAKVKGYRLKKSELDSNMYKYLMRFDGAYYKLGLLDATFSIIDNGEPATVYHEPGKVSPLTIKNAIGVCTVMPMNVKDEDLLAEENNIIIDVKGDE